MSAPERVFWRNKGLIIYIAAMVTLNFLISLILELKG
jgi:hypothetical protein